MQKMVASGAWLVSLAAMVYSLLFRFVLSRIDPERVHAFAARALALVTSIELGRTIVRRVAGPTDPRLAVEALGLPFPSPLGVAAGVDKGATWFGGLADLGFGFVEVGTATAEPQVANPAPRLLRITKDRALLNKLGFPNPGSQDIAANLRRRQPGRIVGANIGMTRGTPPESLVADYRAAARALAAEADFLVINVSSPNTQGLRDAQAVDVLRELVDGVRAELADLQLQRPLLVKLAPDLSDEQIDAIADFALDTRLDGLIATNTTIDRSVLSEIPAAASQIDGGGVSGPPLAPRALAVLRRLRARTGEDLTLISVGGISTADDAWERIRAGATLVQAYTGFVYGGPAWPGQVNRGLAEHLNAARLSSIEDAIGAETAQPQATSSA